MNLVEQTIAAIEPADAYFRNRAKERLDLLTMPHWALGRLMDLAIDLAGMTSSMSPKFDNRVIVTMAGDHGVVAEGVSKYPQEVTVQMVYNFLRGGAGINAIARTAKADVVVVDMGIAGEMEGVESNLNFVSKRVRAGTANMGVGPAMTREEAMLSVSAGIEVAHELSFSYSLFGTGDMGIGNTTPSSAIVATFTGQTPEKVTGRGTGIEEDQFLHKVEVIKKILKVNNPDPRDPWDVLSKVGGFEIGGIAGLILGAASRRKPILIDGFISTAGALLAASLCPAARDYMIAAHQSVEQGHIIALDHLGAKPLLNLDMRLGEGTGAALAMTLVDAAVRILTEVATFEEASVSQANV
jgi:nicotinate-nucleotide--dimethylbenzimidazole phosphoribosyltransferase